MLDLLEEPEGHGVDGVPPHLLPDVRRQLVGGAQPELPAVQREHQAQGVGAGVPRMRVWCRTGAQTAC